MGSFQATLTNQTMNAITNIVNDVSQSVFNEASQDCSASNTYQISFGGVPNCPAPNVNNSTINITQVAGSKCNLNSQNVNKLSATIKNSLNTRLQSYITNDLSNKQGWFATAISMQIADANTVETIANQITNSFSSNFTNICQAVATAYNNNQLVFCGNYNMDTFNFNQNAMISALTSCINQNLSNILANNSVLNELVAKTDAKLASEQSGFNLKWLFAIPVIIIIIILIVFLIRHLSGKKTKVVEVSPDSVGSITSTNVSKMPSSNVTKTSFIDIKKPLSNISKSSLSNIIKF